MERPPFYFMVDLATRSLHAILSGDDYHTIHGVPIFDVHDEYGADGKLADRYDLARLQRMCSIANARAQRTGDLAPFGPGHTIPISRTRDGRLDMPREEDQPPIWGFFHNFRIEHYGPERLPAITVDCLVKKQVRRQGKDGNAWMQDGREAFREFPRRSVEIDLRDDDIDWLALLRTAPMRDLGLATAHSKDVYYDQRRELASVVIEGKRRYALGVNMADFDPTQQPDASQPIDVPPAAPAGDMTPDDKERYSRGLFGHPHATVSKLFEHLHKRYGMEAGCEEPARYDAASACVPDATNAFVPGKDEKVRMQKHDEDEQVKRLAKAAEDIAVARYQKDNAELTAKLTAAEQRIAALETDNMYEQLGTSLISLQGQGYNIDPAAELEWCKTKRYSKAQCDDHLEVLKRYQKAPVNEPTVQTVAAQPAKRLDEDRMNQAKSLATRKNISFDEALAQLN